MNFLKKAISGVSGLMLFLGFFLLIGTAGSSDYAEEMGEVWNWKEHIPYAVVGIVMMVVGSLILNYLERGDERSGR